MRCHRTFTALLLIGAASPAAPSEAGEAVFNGPFSATERDSLGGELIANFHKLSLGPGGRVHVAYSPGGQRIRVPVSHDGGFTWGGPAPDLEPWKQTWGAETSHPAVLSAGIGVLWSAFPPFPHPDEHQVWFTRLDATGRLIDHVLVRARNDETQEGFFRPELASAGDRHLAIWWRLVDLERGVRLTVESALSEDEGSSWSLFEELGPIPNDDRIGPALVASPDGAFYLAFSFKSYHPQGDSIAVYRLDPGAIAWTPVGSPRLFADEVNGEPDLAAGPSGEIGLTLSMLPNGYPPVEVWMSISRDRGESWTDLHRVSPLSRDHHAFSRIAVDRQGHWHLGWLGRGNSFREVLYARSLGVEGTSWTEPVVVNREPGTVPVNRIGLAIAEDDHVVISHPYETGRFEGDLRTAIHVMTTRTRPWDGYDDLPFYTLTASPNPFRGSTLMRIPAPAPVRAELRLFDASGRLVRAWPELALERGPNPITWDGRRDDGVRSPAGVYYWHVRFEGGPDVRGRIVKMSGG